ncbi:uncharacterized protein Z518_01602 [Rhinocladiella mackenziei CBS 650.93]|uniref:37S ribosomal protein S35, mitochondrial n=1 Tax=Rhinocladiella mackenziei CBS 650.93 TaxID=1442369 RepID=A0A0D2IX12_9EURO|nr:uncharacterized protein Z518_01602 [Rhinocladiella mackenziei CBS 650.93]KIX10519.1 hypothetical protein Z518_01602 [Rhinocladiella mackenziei CBS 650.93]
MPPRIPPSAASIALPAPSVHTHCKSCLNRLFSSTPAPHTRQRSQFLLWLQGPGENFRHPLPGSTNYLSAYNRKGQLLRGGDSPSSQSPNPSNAPLTEDEKALEAATEEPKVPRETEDDLRPFPLNKHFISQSILSDELREEIWRRVQEVGKSVRQVSVEMGVDMRRVAAVVRLVEVERRMKAEGKQLALPYARAIHSMVPVNRMNPMTRKPMEPHESINDLDQHPFTYPQIFYPASESRAFNRTDAGRVFSGAPRLPDDQDIGQGGKPAQEPWQDTKPEYVGKPGHQHPILKPADSRIPHPHLIAYEKDKQSKSFSNTEVHARYLQRLQEDEEKRKDARERQTAAEESKKTRIDNGRWQFVVTEVMATRRGTGLDGRGTRSPGIRYGVPSQHRKKGHVKIPTDVQV